MAHDAFPDSVQRASSISVAACEHGNLYVRFHGGDGVIFAAASMDVETAAQLAENFTAEIEAVAVAIIAQRDARQ